MLLIARMLIATTVDGGKGEGEGGRGRIRGGERKINVKKKGISLVFITLITIFVL